MGIFIESSVLVVLKRLIDDNIQMRRHSMRLSYCQRILSTALAILIAGCSTTGIIETHEIRLVDSDGTTRGVFGLSEDGNPGLLLFDQSEQIRAGLRLLPDGVGFLLIDESGMERISMMIQESGAYITASDSMGMREASIVVPEDRLPALVILNENREPRLIVGGTDDDSDPTIRFFDVNGIKRELPVQPEHE
jgi:hypothetical protein